MFHKMSLNFIKKLFINFFNKSLTIKLLILLYWCCLKNINTFLFNIVTIVESTVNYKNNV